MHVVIVGGGIAGLATAYSIREGAHEAGLPVECTLVEGATRWGGKVVTARERGFVIEGGPDCFITQKPWALDLCRRLGLEDRFVGTNDHPLEGQDPPAAGRRPPHRAHAPPPLRFVALDLAARQTAHGP
ncbi:MAG: FAD-dependent oxidoreductase [Chloroflexota bacterium]